MRLRRSEFEPISGDNMADEIWESIINYLKDNQTSYIPTLSPRAQPVGIVAIKKDHIKIQFLESGNVLYMEKSRFVSAYIYAKGK